jgi:hypothetical protein
VLGALDQQASGLPRGAVLSCLLELGECVVLERCGEPVGFSILRRFGQGLVVGPVVAPNAADARALISVWLDRFRGQFIRVDVETESGLGDWLRKRGLKPVGTVTAMVRGERPSAPGPARLYALVNQALG